MGTREGPFRGRWLGQLCVLEPNDASVHRRLNELIEGARRQPLAGLGKPEALKGDLSGWWSRRITAEHRLIYRVQGRKGEDQRLEIVQCRYHY